MKSKCAALLFFSFAMTACNPVVVQTNEEPDGSPAKQDEPEPVIESQPEVEPPSIAETENRETSDHYILLSEPWKKYFRGEPQLFVVDSLSKGIQDLLTEEQNLIKSVLDSSATAGESSEYAELEERLNELKTMIPSAETASGYVATGSRSYSYVSGNTVYTRTGRTYYNGYYYTNVRAKQKSSSPALVRSVQGLVHNATLDLEDLDQRIEALQNLISKWSRRTSEMNASGTSGIMRDANEAYLSILQNFTKDFSALRTEVSKVENEQARSAQNKSLNLEKWKSFENNRLNILSEYLQSNAKFKIEPKADGTFPTPDLKPNEQLVMVCTIGERDLYFEVSPERHKMHPFVLVDVTPQP